MSVAALRTGRCICNGTNQLLSECCWPPAAAVESRQQQYWAAIPPVHRVSWLSGLRGSGTNMKPPPQGPWARCNPRRWMHSERAMCTPAHKCSTCANRWICIALHNIGLADPMFCFVLKLGQRQAAARCHLAPQVPCTLLSRMVRCAMQPAAPQRQRAWSQGTTAASCRQHSGCW